MDKKSISFTLGTRLKELRQEHGLSHVQLSNQLRDKYGISVSRDSLMAYEVADDTRSKADKLPNLGMRVEYLYCLADFYGVSVDYLLGKTDIPSKDMKVREICEYTGLSEQSIMRLCRAKYKGQDFNLWAGLADSVLHTGYLDRYCVNAWKYAMARIQIKNNMLKRTEEDKEEMRRLVDDIADSVLDAQTTSFLTKISVYDAARYYKNAAIDQVKRAAGLALEKYLDAMMTYNWDDENTD